MYVNFNVCIALVFGILVILIHLLFVQEKYFSPNLRCQVEKIERIFHFINIFRNLPCLRIINTGQKKKKFTGN